MLAVEELSKVDAGIALLVDLQVFFSDAFALKTKAQKKGDEYVLNGIGFNCFLMGRDESLDFECGGS